MRDSKPWILHGWKRSCTIHLLNALKLPRIFNIKTKKYFYNLTKQNELIKNNE